MSDFTRDILKETRITNRDTLRLVRRSILTLTWKRKIFYQNVFGSAGFYSDIGRSYTPEELNDAVNDHDRMVAEFKVSGVEEFFNSRVRAELERELEALK